ncbi:hypothetical protein [Dyella dinghuensis]|uniref:hypothetical protein n=1 Tax=Dyella dinghuensis TaxID=1920169 RepID=UPI0018F4005E|nr:hypothetical protein [Dyella dinghuensis]
MSQRWLITGSSRGIGRALSEAVLQAGHRLVATARDRAGCHRPHRRTNSRPKRAF